MPRSIACSSTQATTVQSLMAMLLVDYKTMTDLSLDIANGGKMWTSGNVYAKKVNHLFSRGVDTSPSSSAPENAADYVYQHRSLRKGNLLQHTLPFNLPSSSEGTATRMTKHDLVLLSSDDMACYVHKEAIGILDIPVGFVARNFDRKTLSIKSTEGFQRLGDFFHGSDHEQHLQLMEAIKQELERVTNWHLERGIDICPALQDVYVKKNDQGQISVTILPAIANSLKEKKHSMHEFEYKARQMLVDGVFYSDAYSVSNLDSEKNEISAMRNKLRWEGQNAFKRIVREEWRKIYEDHVVNDVLPADVKAKLNALSAFAAAVEHDEQSFGRLREDMDVYTADVLEAANPDHLESAELDVVNNAREFLSHQGKLPATGELVLREVSAEQRGHVCLTEEDFEQMRKLIERKGCSISILHDVDVIEEQTKQSNGGSGTLHDVEVSKEEAKQSNGGSRKLQVKYKVFPEIELVRKYEDVYKIVISALLAQFEHERQYDVIMPQSNDHVFPYHMIFM